MNGLCSMSMGGGGGAFCVQNNLNIPNRDSLPAHTHMYLHTHSRKLEQSGMHACTHICTHTCVLTQIKRTHGSAFACTKMRAKVNNNTKACDSRVSTMREEEEEGSEQPGDCGAVPVLCRSLESGKRSTACCCCRLGTLPS